MLLLLLACTNGPETPTDTGSPLEPEPQASGLVGPADAGFGAAVALSPDGTLWIGAPHGEPAALYRATSSDDLALALEGSGRLGAALAAAADSDALVVGAPLADSTAGEVRDGSGALLAGGGQSAGLAVAWSDGWLAAHAKGWRSAEHSQETAARPSSLAAMVRDGVWVVGVGMAHSETMLQAGETTLAAPQPHAEAGYALAAGDVDGDGEPEWIVGAPAASAVYIVSADATAIEQTLTGSGRFGAALAVADVDADGTADLLVGAPMEGNGAQGAAYLYTAGDLSSAETAWTGSREGGQLGFSVAMVPGHLAIGEPGGAGQAGQVTLLRY